MHPQNGTRHEPSTVLNRKSVTELRPLVRVLARRYAWSGLDRDDLEAAGWMGLVEASRRYDAAKGASLGSYAYPFIRAAMRAALAKGGLRSNRAESLSADSDELAPAPSSAELDPEASLVHAAAAAALRSAIERLPPREREVIEGRWLTQGATRVSDLSAQWGVTPARIRQIELEALAKLRRFLEPLAPEGPRRMTETRTNP